jgi:hypothetical protein
MCFGGSFRKGISLQGTDESEKTGHILESTVRSAKWPIYIFFIEVGSVVASETKAVIIALYVEEGQERMG